MKYPAAKNFRTLSKDDLRWRCDPDIFSFDSTVDIEPIEGIIGQERALRALKLGVEMRSPGYNIYIAGLSGTGKTTTVKQILERLSAECPPVYDYAYANNFSDPDNPVLLVFPKGKARHFRSELNSAIDILKQKIPQALESDSYMNRKKKIINSFSEIEQKMMSEFDEKIQKDDFRLGQVSEGGVARADILPVINDKPVPVHQLEEQIQKGYITKEKAQEIIKKYNVYQQELQILFKKGLKVSKEFQQRLTDLEKETSQIVVKSVFESLKEVYEEPKIRKYIEEVEESILENIQIFKGLKPDGDTTPEGFTIDYFRVFDINIILDNTNCNSCPIIIETSPTYSNLFGSIEKINDGRGGWYSDFTKIKAGSLLKANGGYIVLNVLHLFEEPGVWKTLKRVLTYNKLEIQDQPSLFQLGTTSLKPEPINIDTKVILVGSNFIYTLLTEREYDFKKMFKVKADFDYETDRTDKVLVEYARVIKKIIKQENLLDFDKTAIARIIEIAAVFAGRKDKLTTRFSKLTDLAREADFWARDDGFKIVSEAHVDKAFRFARDRHGMLESKINEMYEDKSFLIDVDGERVGQINGLAIYNADFYSFGRPTRITATVSLGSGNIINVEREAGMSGRHYNKGVLIISGYFKETFGQDLPLSFNANLVFEQSYGTVDGDSASCAEIFALLSTLSGLPIKQSIAVTGSLNQKGDVQPIGGVNEKIEGFFDICKVLGFTGKQGVIIPVQNIRDLMLKEEIIEAVDNKKFHIYPIERVEEGIEILTGVRAGKRTKTGYPANSVFDLVEKKIREMYTKSRAMKTEDNNSPARRKKRK
ncbi:MAG: ATP-binding protein [Ignavibacteriaceae bacterium]